MGTKKLEHWHFYAYMYIKYISYTFSVGYGIGHNRLSLASGNEITENEYTNKRTQDVYVENPKREKPREPKDSELLHYV